MAKQSEQFINQLDKEEAKWFAIYTNYKREKLVKQMLDQKEVECYLPIRKVVKQWSKKRRTMELPLISCYIFAKITAEQYITVLETEYVLKFVRIGRDLIAIPEEEIQIIKNILSEEVDFEINNMLPLEKGDAIEIVSGSLSGIKGKLVEVEGKNRVLITLDHLQHTFTLSLDKNLIKRI